MKRVNEFTMFTLLSVIGIAMSACSASKPEQLNLILRIDEKRPASLQEIVTAMAARTGMRIDLQDFDYGGENGVLKVFLVSGSRISVMIRSISDEECHLRAGRRDPTFSRVIYGVSIYRSSIFEPKMPLQEVSMLLSEEAKRRGGVLLPESQKCLPIPELR